MLGENRPKMQTGGNYEPLPSDKYTVQIADVNAIKDSWQGKEQDKFKFTFVVLTDKKFKTPNGDESTRGRRLWHKFSTYVTAKSFLTKFMLNFEPTFASWTEDQKTNYNLDLLIGKQIDVLVSKDAGTDGRIWNNIKSFEPCQAELEPWKDVKEGEEQARHTTSVPVTAPADAPSGETADDFVANLEKDNKAAKAKKEVVEETPKQKKIREAKEALAALESEE